MCLPIDSGKIRLYCLRISDEILILGNGGIKNTAKYQENNELLGYTVDLQKFDRLIKEELKNGSITIEEHELKNVNKRTFEIDFLLKKKGMTHRDLAKAIGCNETQIIRWTKGFPNYTLSSLAKISNALGEPLIFTSLSNNQNAPVHYYNMEPERTLMVCDNDENKK